MAPRLYRLLCCVLFLLSPALMAQSQHAAINGRVTDNKGKPIFGINIVLEGTGKGGATDTDGRFTIRGIPPGTYNLLVSGIAYKKQTKSITLTAGQTGKINVRLNESVLQMREEVVVTGKSVAEQIQETGYAVNVVRTEETRQRTADLGEVLARTEGVSVRRTGGLGSGTRFSLAGLTDDQIRIFLDGIPLAFTPYAFGISNVPVNLLARVEIYKGVVPSRFGADALGGAVNLVSQTVAPGLRGSASYQTGSFGTHRMVTMINYWDDKTGISASGGGFYDYANNNYKVDVDIADAQGRLRKVTVPRFHDSYQAFGGNIAVGVKDKQWADEFSIKGFYSGFDKDIQHNQIMAGIPFGEVKTLRTSGGVNLKYRNGISDQFDVDLIIGHNSNERVFVDTARFAYNWFGERILEKNEPGEISGRYGASHQFTWDDNYFARMNAAYQIAKNNTLHLSMAPTFTRRTGDERFAGNFYALNATGALFSWVNGLEYSLDAFHERLQNKLFVKHYIQKQESERDIPNNPDPLVAQREYSYFGWGNGLRLTLSPRLSTKFTYEYAIRMPRQDEVFGDGQFILKNLELEPERSHNANLELRYSNSLAGKSDWQIQANFFLRKVNDLILLLSATDHTNIYQNVYEANSAGLELSGKWKGWSDRFIVTMNSTYQHFYNSSRAGEFERFSGDRIPNAPYYFANGSARYAFPALFSHSDKLTFFLSSRYVHQFFLSWESVGIKDFKLEIPSQFINNAGFTYELPFNGIRTTLTGEIQNLTDAQAFDFLGVQKPGRAFYGKMTVNF